MPELWKAAHNTPTFEVSTLGRIRNTATSNILALSLNHKGYKTVVVRPGGKYGSSILIRVGRSVAVAFLPNPNNLPEVNHKDGDKTNDSVDNLEWMTSEDNSKHAIDTGLRTLHEPGMHPKCSIAPHVAEYIVAHYTPRHPEFGARALGRKLGINHGYVSKIAAKERRRTTDSA